MNGFTKRAVVFMMAATMAFTSGGVAVYADDMTEVQQTAMQAGDQATDVADQVTDAADQMADDVNTTVDEATEDADVTHVAKYVAVYSTRVYSKKSTKKKYREGILHWKDMVEVLDQTKTWTQISYGDGTGYVKTKYLTANEIVIDYAETSYTKYTKKKTKIYKAPSVYSAKSGKYKKNKKLTCLGTCGKFTVVKKGSKEVFVKTSYLSNTKTKSKKKSKSRAAVAKYALKFVGNPYKWGGTSLTHGADCSGFTMSVYKHFGVSLPHSSSAQRHYGKSVKLKNAKAGDLVCYSGHVGIYIGHGKIVHASNSKPYPKGGIKVSSVHIMKIITIRRLL